jgi:hypothetical protein
MRNYTISDFRRDMRYGAYAWPGGYQRFFLTDDGECLSLEAARENRRLILDSIANGHRDGWRIVGCDINWEDADMVCAHTGKPIPASYA